MKTTTKKKAKGSKPMFVYFWLKSSRGTDVRLVYQFKTRKTDDEIRDHLEEWASRHPAWNHGENALEYGWREVKMPPRSTLLARFKAAGEAYQKAKEHRDTLAAMLNPLEVREGDDENNA
jgi:hypothetical protein